MSGEGREDGLAEACSKAVVESSGDEQAGQGLELFRILSEDRGLLPVIRAVELVLRAPVIWGLILASTFGYHLAADWVVAMGWLERGLLFPTLLAPLSQAFHAGLVVLAAGAAVDALRSTSPPRALPSLRRWGLRALQGMGAFLVLRLLLDGLALPARLMRLADLWRLLLLLWIWVHVAAELTLFDRGPMTALPRGVLRALRRALGLPKAILSSEGRSRRLREGELDRESLGPGASGEARLPAAPAPAAAASGVGSSPPG